MFIPLKAATNCFNVLSEIPLKEDQSAMISGHNREVDNEDVSI